MPRIREYYITLSACHNSIGLVFHFCRRGWLGPAAKGEGGGGGTGGSDGGFAEHIRELDR